LFVGNLKPHKNLDSLLRAFSQLVVDRSFNYRLVVVGDDRKYRSSVMTRIRQLHLQTRVEVISGLGQGQLIDFYRAAEALVLPSFEEGFGLPVLEAMACDTPVICSHAASLPEVGGDAVQYFDPYSPEDMAQRIGEVLGSDEKRTRLSSLGRARSKLFTWDKTFENHLRIYRNYLEQPSATAAVAEQHSW
jgi:glycosyltransferase involved in cell wall biosynthesis